MVKSCAAINCTERFVKDAGITFHSFPIKNDELTRQWVVAMYRDFTPRAHHCLCSKHFTDNDFLKGYVNIRKLKPDAVPSIFDIPQHLLEVTSQARETKVENKRLSEENPSGNEPTTTVVPVDHSYSSSRSRSKVTNIKLEPEEQEDHPGVNVGMPLDNEMDQVINIKVEPDLSTMELQDDSDDEANAQPGMASYEEMSQVVLQVKEEVTEDEDCLGSVEAAEEPAFTNEQCDDVTHEISLGEPDSSTSEDIAGQSKNMEVNFHSVWLADMQMDQVCVKEEPPDDVGACAEQGLTAEVKMEVGLEEHNTDITETSDVEKEVDVHEGRALTTSRPTPKLKRHRIYKCLPCGDIFSTLAEITEHVKTHPKTVTYKCSECGKFFLSASRLERHRKRIHLKKVAHECIHCRKIYRSLWSLREHVRTHMEEDPYKCKECGKTYSNRKSIKDHMRTHMEKDPYKCKVCGKCYSSNLYFKRHEKKHREDTDQYKCTDCDKSCSSKMDLKDHIRTHLEKDLYVCKYCDKTFACVKDFIKHVNKH